ncbi:MAG: hypothetical protein Q8P41_20615 [Pseudomonadota bacterium]|nr:hypothetical protein [Pseudomonadota bacterium]
MNARRVLALASCLLPGLLLVGCESALDKVGLHFDGPVAAAVLPADAGPWEVPTGFVANSRNGTITPLDLKMGRLLTDDPVSSFLRSGAIPTGEARLLSDVGVVAGDDGSVTLWAIDNAFEQLLRVPYILSVDEDGFPVETEPSATDPVFVDADGSGDSPTLTNVELKPGYTTTEDWSIEYDGTRWWAKGSRSGIQGKEPVAGEPYRTDNRELAFQIDGTATVGDRFDLATATGVREYSFPGRPTALLAQDGRVYVSVAADPARVVVYDGITGEVLGTVELGSQALGLGAQPARMSAAPDGRLFIADAALPQVWVVRFDQDPDPATAPIEVIPVAAPALDVAWQGGYDRDGTPFDHLFVAPAALLRVDVWDLTANAWLDPNPVTQDTDGIFIGGPVTGLAASVGDVKLPAETSWGAAPRVPTVAVATSDGFVYLLEASTGCGVFDDNGFSAENTAVDDGGATFIYLDDQGEISDSVLWYDDYNAAQVVASSCGGVARTETWTVRYDTGSLSWEVEGSLSGVQDSRAYDGERYVSDTGAISFVIGSGARPPTEGDTFAFNVDDGLRVFRGTDENQDGAVDPPWEFPGRPVAYETLSGPSGGGWDPVDRRQYVLLPVTNTDIAAQLHLDSGKSELLWQ